MAVGTSKGVVMSPRTARIRPGLRGVALAVASLTLAGSSAAAALAAPAARQAGPASLVPLSKVGLGWSIAEYSAASVATGHNAFKGKTTLYAVSPQGRKYAFYSWPASFAGPSSYYLTDWSGDGQRVLVQNFYNRFEQISLATGKVVSRFTLPASVPAIGYTRPDGENVLTLGPNGMGVRRYNLQGQLQKVLSGSGFSAIESPDGTSIIVEASYGLEQVSNVGGVIKRLRPPLAVSGCYPERWWNATTILAACYAARGPAESRLWLFPVNGGQVTALTAQRNGTGEDQGDIDAWKLISGVYLQSLGPCGVEFIGTQSRNGSVHQVNVPGVHYASDHIVTGQGSSLVVEADNGCAAGASLVLFNPGTRKVTWVFRAPAKVIGTESAVPFGRPLS
jgi:hypothetical protein